MSDVGGPESQPQEESVEELAARIVQDVRKGKRPSVSHLEEEFPDIDDEEIDGLVRTLSILEEASHRRRRARPAGGVIDAAGNRQHILGGYRLFREIARGGMGIVYEAEQESLHRRVALKVLPPSPLLTDTERARFVREGRAIARLHHSHIVPVFGTGEQDGVQYCVMQLINGYSLQNIIDKIQSRLGLETSKGPISSTLAESDVKVGKTSSKTHPVPDKATELLTGHSDWESLEDIPSDYYRKVAALGANVADALSHAHQQGVLHRDIKPANLLLDSKGHVWVTDFGLAHLHDEENLTQGNLVGTLRYTPRERFAGEADERSDVYSLGLTLYEMCTMQAGYTGTDRKELFRKLMNETPPLPRTINPRIPRELETVISKAIHPEPQNRYQTADDFARDLRNFIAERPLLARRHTALDRAWWWCRRHRMETSLIAIAVSMLVFTTVVSSIAYIRESGLRRDSESLAEQTRSALDNVYESYLPGWSSSSKVSVHGETKVTPEQAQLLDELAEVFDQMAIRSSENSRLFAVLESTTALRRVGSIYHRLGQFDKSLNAYTRAADRLADVYKLKPNDRYLLEQARVANDIGELRWAERFWDDAYPFHEQAIDKIQAISRDNQGSYPAQFELARSLFLLGRREHGLDYSSYVSHAPKAEDAPPESRVRTRALDIEYAIRILEDLLDADPTKDDTRHLLGLCYREKSDGQLDDQGQAQDQWLPLSIELLNTVAQSQPDNPGYQFSLCTTLQWIRNPESLSKLQLLPAKQRYTEAIEIANKLAQRRPDEWAYSAAAVRAHLSLANVNMIAGEQDKALLLLSDITEPKGLLRNSFSNQASFDCWLAIGLTAKARTLLALDQPERAQRASNEAATVFEEMLIQELPGWRESVIHHLKMCVDIEVDALEKMGSKSKAKAARQRGSNLLKRWSVRPNPASE